MFRFLILAWHETSKKVPTTPHMEDRSLSNGPPLKYAVLPTISLFFIVVLRILLSLPYCFYSNARYTAITSLLLYSKCSVLIQH